MQTDPTASPSMPSASIVQSTPSWSARDEVVHTWGDPIDAYGEHIEFGDGDGGDGGGSGGFVIVEGGFSEPSTPENVLHYGFALCLL